MVVVVTVMIVMVVLAVVVVVIIVVDIVAVLRNSYLSKSSKEKVVTVLSLHFVLKFWTSNIVLVSKTTVT
jgi:hypothetical protein